MTDQPRCSATTRAGKPCRRWVQQRADGSWYSVCERHGAGKEGARGGRPIMHGLKSTMRRAFPTLGDLLDSAESTPPEDRAAESLAVHDVVVAALSAAVRPVSHECPGCGGTVDCEAMTDEERLERVRRMTAAQQLSHTEAAKQLRFRVEAETQKAVSALVLQIFHVMRAELTPETEERIRVRLLQLPNFSGTVQRAAPARD